MALIFCTECGKKVSDSAKACPGCGFPISEYLNKKKCPECGEYISDNDSVCGNCGFPLKEDEGKENPTGDTTVKTSVLTQQVIKNLIFSVRIVGALWLIVGIIQFGISCYINSLYKSFVIENIKRTCVQLGIVGIVNMCWGVGQFIKANYCEKNKTTIWNSCRIGVLDVICYIWNGIVVITILSIGGEYTILAIVVLAAILVEAIAVKRVIYVYKDEFSAMANKEAEKEEAIHQIARDISMNDDLLPGDYWPCPKCDGPIKIYPCKYCGYIEKKKGTN